MNLAAIDQAREANGWKRVVALAQTHPGGDGYVPHGVALIDRGYSPSGRPGTEFATCGWYVREGEAGFESGRYDLTIDEAWESFKDRAGALGKVGRRAREAA